MDRLTILAVAVVSIVCSIEFMASPSIQPPHCIRTPIVLAKGSRGIQESWRSVEMQMSLGLHTTICFRLEEDEPASMTNSTLSSNHSQSWLHTLTLAHIEHHHPVTERYNFGVPEVHADCFCECEWSAKCSSHNYEFLKCPPEDSNDANEACYRTFFPNQNNQSCEVSSPTGSFLCCDLKFRPYENRTYTAVNLGQPSTFATFAYVAYDFVGGRWVVKDRNYVRMQIDGRSQQNVLDSTGHLRLSVSPFGRVSHQLDAGMYFTERNEGGEMDGIRKETLNHQSDTNLLHLGWYRKDDKDGHFFVNNGAVLLKSMHGAKVVDCKGQTYTSSLAANFYMPGRFTLPPTVEDSNHWIERAAFYDGSMRQVIVSHAEGTNLHVSLELSNGNGNNLVFLHNSSRINSFSGSLLVDSRSNRYLNISVGEASGKLNGVIHASDSVRSPQVYTFTVYVSEVSATNRSFVVPLPATIDAGRKLVCIKAEETRDEDSLCSVLPYSEEPLEIDVENNSWRTLKGKCTECNHVGYHSFLQNLNPLHLFSGIQSVGDGMSKLTDIFVYIAALVVIYLLITKLMLPVCQCCVCPLFLLKMKAREERRLEKSTSRKAVVEGQFV